MRNEWITTRALHPFRWEADVEIGNTLYTFTGWTRWGAVRQAERFLSEHHGE